MKAIVLYKLDSEYSRAVDEFNREFTRRTPYNLKLVDVDSASGTSQAELYDIVQYPSVVVIREDGQLLKSWSGVPLPTVNDVAGYLVEH